MKGIISITISKDMMSAVADVLYDEVNELTHEYISSELERYGIKAGVVKSAVDAIVAGEVGADGIEIARGKDAKSGTRGHYEFTFDVTKKDYKPEILEDGTVDYTYQRQLVNKGDLLAVYMEPAPGFFGFTIYASVVAPVPLDDEPLLELDGVVKDGNRYYAALDGEVSVQDGKLVVTPTLYINGNATNTLGDIVFTGDIYVSGDVLAGTSISAEGSVFVDGTVEAAEIDASKDIVIRKGILGQGKANITANGSLKAAFIEEATIIVDDTVECNYAYCSNILAKGAFIAEGKNASVIGGRVESLNKIQIKRAGNDAQVKTDLIIKNVGYGIDPLSCIIVEKEVHQGVNIYFGDAKAKISIGEGEYHFVNGAVRRYAVGGFEQFVPELVQPQVPQVIRTILLVDDEPMILKTFFSHLKDDYKVIAVNSAKDAFKLMEKTIPDLILLDINMPDMNGIQMLEQMRRTTWKLYNNVPVIFATAVSERAIVQKCLSLYPQGYIIKPLGEADLKRIVKNSFDSKELI